jgi:RNA polymerase subunit RPABC4/transcription elongation factor Spt4
MQLKVARLCLDCQEIHAEDRCPVCTSEAFGFMTRWVKIDTAPSRVAPHEKTAGRTSKVDSYRQILNPTSQRSTAGSWLRKGSLLMAAGYLARWGWQIAANRTRPPQGESSGSNG